MTLCQFVVRYGEPLELRRIGRVLDLHSQVFVP